MSTVTILNPTTSASSGTFDAAAYAGIVIFATGLAGAEEIDVLIGGGNTTVVATKADGTALTLTADSPSAFLEGGPLYVLNKDATAGVAGVYAAPRLP